MNQEKEKETCPICMNEKDKENFKLLEHFEDQDGDVSSHKMCNKCYNEYKDKTKCPFCNLKLKVSFEDSGMDEIDYHMHMKFGNMTDEEIARKNRENYSQLYNGFINTLNFGNFSDFSDVIESARIIDESTNRHNNQRDLLRYFSGDMSGFVD